MEEIGYSWLLIPSFTRSKDKEAILMMIALTKDGGNTHQGDVGYMDRALDEGVFS